MSRVARWLAAVVLAAAVGCSDNKAETPKEYAPPPTGGAKGLKAGEHAPPPPPPVKTRT